MLTRGLILLLLAAASCAPAPTRLELPYGNGSRTLIVAFQEGQSCSFDRALGPVVAIDLEGGEGAEQLPELRFPTARPAYQIRATALLYRRSATQIVSRTGALEANAQGSPLAAPDETWETVLASGVPPEWHQTARPDVALCDFRFASASTTAISCDREAHACPR
jgi:hypothetical protein